jgi:hypothetical protein
MRDLRVIHHHAGGDARKPPRATEALREKGINRVITTPRVGSPPRVTFSMRPDIRLKAQLTATPVAAPPVAMKRKLTDASRSEKTPDSADVIANFSATSPDASFIGASP